MVEVISGSDGGDRNGGGDGDGGGEDGGEHGVLTVERTVPPPLNRELQTQSRGGVRCLPLVVNFILLKLTPCSSHIDGKWWAILTSVSLTPGSP